MNEENNKKSGLFWGNLPDNIKAAATLLAVVVSLVTVIANNERLLNTLLPTDPEVKDKITDPEVKDKITDPKVKDKITDLPKKPSEIKKSFPVSAKEAWQNTWIEVRTGDKIKINATGKWSAIDCLYYYKKHTLCKSNKVRLHDANGIIDQNSIRHFPVKKVHLGALVGRVGSNVFLVGSEYENLIESNGWLELGIQDCYDENKGEKSCLRDNDQIITANITVVRSFSE